MKITEILTESMSPSELRWLDDLADRLFNQLNIDVEFTKHFFDRANDERNDYRDQQGRQHEQGITAEELAKVFVAAYKQASDKNSKFVKVTDIPANSEATIRDHFTKLNIPFVMKKESGQKVLTPKTVMRKDNFANPPGTKAVPVNSKDVALSEATAPKPRNFVAKNAKMGGAGQHVDKKKAEKQGDVKHRKSFMAQEVDEGETRSKHNNKRVGGMSKKSVKATSWDVLPNYLAKNYPNVSLVDGWGMVGIMDKHSSYTRVWPNEFQDGRWPGEESLVTNNDPEAHDAVISAIKYVTPNEYRNQIGKNNNLYFEIELSTIPGSVVAGYVTLVDKAEADEDIPSIIEFTVNMNGKTVGKHTTETDRWGFDPSVEYDALHDAIKLFKRTENKTINVQDGGRNILWSFDTPANIKKAMEDGDEEYNIAEGETWSKHNNKRAGGMSKKSVKSYRRSHPGSKIQTAVTTKPSKIKKGSKDAKRRKSFCARMKGMKKHNTSSKTAHDPNSNINKSLRRWHCESIEQMQELIMIAEQKIRNLKK